MKKNKLKKNLIEILVLGYMMASCVLYGNEKKQNEGRAVTSVLYTGNEGNNPLRGVDENAEYPGGKWKPGKAKYGYEIVENISIPMDDGVILNATVAYPTDLKTGKRVNSKFPVIVEHMPYEQFAAPVRINTYFTQFGYISLFVRARGTGKSEGEVQFLSPREGQDGKNIVDWAAYKLENSDGRVAIMGCSWPGAIAMTDAAYVGKNSPLKAVAASCSGIGNMNTQSWMTGGMPSMSIHRFKALGTQLVGEKPSTVRFFKEVSDSIFNGEDLAYEGKYWSERENFSLAEKIVENDVPLLLWAGWGDIVETGTVRAYTALQNASSKRPVGSPMIKNQKTSPKYQLIMGGWGHGEGLDMGLILQWFETWVKGVDTGLQNTKTPMHIFESGTERWINIKGFTEVDKSTQLNLGPKGKLGATLINGKDKLKYAQPDAKDGKLIYTTEVFKDGATISGAISTTIYARSNNSNMVLIGHLYDISENGERKLITRGAMIGSLRKMDKNNSWIDDNGVAVWPWLENKKDEFLKSGQIYKFDLSLAPRQWGIKPGHKLELEITTQTPESVCPKNGVPQTNDSEPCGLTAIQEKTVPGGEYEILYGKNTRSALNLPLLPYEHFKEVKSGRLSAPWNEGFRRLQKPESDSKIYTLPLEW